METPASDLGSATLWAPQTFHPQSGCVRDFDRQRPLYFAQHSPVVVLKLSCPEKPGRCHHLQRPKEKSGTREVLQLAKVTHWSARKWEWMQVPRSLVLCSFLWTFLAQPTENPRGGLPEARRYGNIGGINATAPPTPEAAQFPCLADSTPLQYEF